MHLLPPPPLGKKGFTLAEVLITLAIIGVVAALTIPSVVKNYRDTQYKTQFKKAYAAMSVALQKTIVDMGAVPLCYNDSTIYSGCSEFFSAFAKNLKYTKYCENNSLADGCVPKYKKYYEGNSCVGFNEDYMNNVNNTWVLADGSILIGYAHGKAIFGYDINGAKAPNMPGVDLFPFYLYYDTNKGFYLSVVPHTSYRYCAQFVAEEGRTTEDMLKWAYK